MSSGRRLLLADDDPRDVELALLALENADLADRVDVVRDGEAVMDHLRRLGATGGTFPAMVLLDLMMPKVSGLEVIRQVKTDPGLRRIPLVVFTSSSQEKDLRESYADGANAYVVKPMDFGEYLRTVRYIGEFWMNLNALESR